MGHYICISISEWYVPARVGKGSNMNQLFLVKQSYLFSGIQINYRYKQKEARQQQEEQKTRGCLHTSQAVLV